ncbi:MAG: alpha/beta hydrolase [Rhodobiaceae bacterium]|nr:alpha/beta hydrolase [Rhodobiaceae bacterium]
MATVFDTMPPGRRHRVTAPDGVTVEVREWGDPAGPPLVLVTGVAQSLMSFAAQVCDPALTGYRIVSWDPRGHGLSDKPFDPAFYEGPRWSMEVATVLEALDIDRPVLAGWSLGGRIVRQYLMDHGDDALAGLVFLSCRPVEETHVVGPGNTVVNDLKIDDLGSRIDVAARFLRNCFGPAPTQDEFATMLAYNMLCPWEIRLAIGQWLTDTAVSSAALRKVRVPTLIAHGRKDVLVLPEAAETTAKLIPHATAVFYDQCGHSVFHEAASAFNAELARFLASAFAADAVS